MSEAKKAKIDMEGALFCMENPLLDISAEVDDEFLKKYELKADDAILAAEKHMSIFKEIAEKYKVKFTAGGATQNTARVCQWMLQEPNTAVFVGCVGKDEYAGLLSKAATNDGVKVQYLEDEKVGTGVCACLLTGKHRSLVTDLRAANEYKSEHLDGKEIWSQVERAQYFYIGGYFLTVSPPSIMKVAKHAAEQNKLFSINLSAPFIPQFFKEPLMAAVPYADIIFGNESEAAVFAKEQNLGTEDVKEIAIKMSKLPKENQKRPRTVIITQGSEQTLVAIDGELKTFPVEKIEASKIIDTIGAGDAFAGGYLSQLVKGKDLEQCVKGGHYAARVIIQQTGCTFPDHKPEF